MIGTLLGNRYKLLEKIGEGGMSEVYKAQCELLNRFVAVKILKGEFARDSEFVEKFKREATAAASLSHNNIVNIYDVGSQQGVHYIVMEYIKGKTLKEVVIERGILKSDDAIFIAIQIARALECAHRNNIIHRDIKPQNILVTDEGIVKVADFGIAKATNSATITNTSKVLGSAHYFSPEQAKGSFVDFRTDIYSLGIVMYEMVTGKVPYDAESPVSVALKHIQEQVIPPRNINPSLSEGFNNVILKSIEKEAIKRYQNIGELLLHLNKIKNNEPVNIKFIDSHNDRTRVMDPLKVDDEIIDEDLDDEEISPNKNRKIVLAIVSILLVLVVGFASGYFIFNGFNNKNTNVSDESIPVPQIVGLKEEDAKRKVESSGLTFQVGGTEKSDEPVGTVISSFPSEGTPIKAKGEVRVIISGGKDSAYTPDLTEIDIEVAKDILNKFGLKIEIVGYRFDDNIPKNCVISQNPTKDSKIQPNTVVEVIVSKGPEVKYVAAPSLNGKTLEEADAILKELKLKLGNEAAVETTDESLSGKIFEQSVEPGTQIKEGSSIDVKCYRYYDGSEARNDLEGDLNEGLAGNPGEMSNLNKVIVN